MECCSGGDVYERLKVARQFSEPTSAKLAQQMLLAVHYLHRHGIAHRDIKLENFVYDKPGSDLIKLIDFGFSRFCESSSPKLQRMRTSCGTLTYVAPEVLKKEYTIQCDMWSLGVTVYIMVSGTLPFHGDRPSSVKGRIAAGSFRMKSERWSTVSK